MRRPKQKTEEQLQEYAELFLEAAPPGTLVRYYPTLPCSEDDFEDSAIRSAPWTMGGQTVVMIDGRRGGVSVRHLALVDPKKPIGGVAGLIWRGSVVSSQDRGGK
jgi:hypothetical protein